MGRSQMQGTPWHYEYGDGKRSNNSKHCVYNVGYCSNKYSQYHKQECEGKAFCDDFDRSDFVNSDSIQSKKNKKKKSTNSQPAQKKPISKQPSKNVSTSLAIYYKEYTVSDGKVKLGDKISVINCSTNNMVTFNINNPKDPYIGKKIGETVELKSANYKITKIKRKQASP